MWEPCETYHLLPLSDLFSHSDFSWGIFKNLLSALSFQALQVSENKATSFKSTNSSISWINLKVSTVSVLISCACPTPLMLCWHFWESSK